ncbi:MAG: mechanosensitive ion channel [Bacteroidia bacterium]|nr:mechanosensitive ion channel [Bacteroidia bacterium]
MDSYALSIGQILLTILVLISSRFIWHKIKLLHKTSLKDDQGNLLPKTIRYSRVALICLTAILLVHVLKIDYSLYPNDTFELRVSSILWVFLVFLIARLADSFLGEYIRSRSEDPVSAISQPIQKSTGGVQLFVWFFLGRLLIHNSSLDFVIFPGEDITITISDVMLAIAMLILAHILSWIIIRVLLSRYYKIKEIDIGAQFALNTLLKYFMYMIAIVAAIQSLGLESRAIWGALAGAAIVVGLGLQQVVNDFASGVILLFERSIVVGNIIKVDDVLGKVKRIGIRASVIETREETTMIIPNSHLVSNNVTNWDFDKPRVKFFIPVGVAYGSDTQLVKEKLLEAVVEDSNVLKYPAPFIWFKSFDDSALLFELHYWSKKLMEEDQVKSEIRFRIDGLFRAAGIQIPFPQRTVHMTK